MVSRWMIALVLFVSWTVRADDQAEQIGIEELMSAVVRIENQKAHIFTADILPTSHGTGFFVGINRDSKEGLIFTNRHVIESHRLDAQRLELEFTTPQRRGERVEARIDYVSTLYDFAVLTFDPKAVLRGNLNHPLRLPNLESPFYDFVANERLLRREHVVAIGNPFESQSITTDGQITGIFFDPNKGPFIQTQTPINPGNSGGPLISMTTGEVIGINTMTMVGADGTHWATPIGPLVEEYFTWKRQQAENKMRLQNGQRPLPTVNDPRHTRFSVDRLEEGALKQMNVYDLIEKFAPGYFEHHSSAFVVTSKEPGEKLEEGDILLRLNGEVIGGHPFDIQKMLSNLGVTVKMQVLRQGRLKTVKVNFPSMGFYSRRSDVDYVYLSGLFIREESPETPRHMAPGYKSRVTVASLLDSPEVNFGGRGFPLPGSLITGVSFGAKTYPVERLLDLKLALKENANSPFVIVYAHGANYVSYNGDKGHPVVSPKTGLPLIDGIPDAFVLPMTSVITPRRFSLHRFRKGFRFEASASATRDWRNFVRCEKDLES